MHDRSIAFGYILGKGRSHRHYQSSGHVWQGRFKAFPLPAGRASPLRDPLRRAKSGAGQVDSHSASPSGARARPSAVRPRGSRCPRCILASVPRGGSELAAVREVSRRRQAELVALRESISRGRPYGWPAVDADDRPATWGWSPPCGLVEGRGRPQKDRISSLFVPPRRFTCDKSCVPFLLPRFMQHVTITRSDSFGDHRGWRTCRLRNRMR